MLVTPLEPAQLTAGWYRQMHQRRLITLALLTLLVSCASAVVVLVLQFVSVAVMLICAVLIAVAWRPIIGLYVAFGLVLLFEVGGPDPLMEPGRFLHYGLQSTLGLSGVIVSPSYSLAGALYAARR